MPDATENRGNSLAAAALIDSAAAMGVMALCIELARASVLPSEALDRVRDAMVDRLDE